MVVDMTEILWIAAVVCIAISVTIVILYHCRMKRILRSLDRMLDKAIDDRFTEETIDESMLSHVEAKFARYLADSEHSARNVAAEKEKIKELISDISHQTKTPVSNILLYSELLSEQALPESSAGYALSIEEQAEKLSFLIAALVKLSRLETGVIALHPEPLPLMPVLEKVYHQFLPDAQDKQLVFTLLPTTAHAVLDEKWMAEAVANIVDNAIKYTKKGSVTIGVKEYELFRCIEISDTGIGIEEEEQAKIFARFYRSAAVSKETGLGIGLYLTREIVTGCGGYIKVSSAVGKGTKFSIYLPSE